MKYVLISVQADLNSEQLKLNFRILTLIQAVSVQMTSSGTATFYVNGKINKNQRNKQKKKHLRKIVPTWTRSQFHHTLNIKRIQTI